MYYDRLRRQVEAIRRQSKVISNRRPILDLLAPCYHELHADVVAGVHQNYNLPGGRGSGKSSFASLEMVNGIMDDPEANGIVFRRVAATLRDSVFNQIQWAIGELGVSELWRANVAPMQFTYTPTGQQIIFRGLDDPLKMKSIKPRRGFFKYVWFEEFSELPGPNMVRNVRQSVLRGGKGFRVFNTFNPPLSLNNWANKHVLLPDSSGLTFKTDYTMMPPEWLGDEFLAEAEKLKAVNEAAYRHEYLGEAVGTGGEVFPNIETRTISQEEAVKFPYTYQGIDWGFAVDPAVWLWVAYDAKTETVTFLDEIYRTHCSNKQLAELIREKNKKNQTDSYTFVFGQVYHETATIYADSAEPKSIADMVDLGLRVRGARKYPGSVLHGIKWLQHRKLVFDPERTPNAYREFVGYEYNTTKDGEFLADVPDKDNHTIDAARYALSMVVQQNNKATA